MRSGKALMMIGAALAAGLVAVVMATQWISGQAKLGVQKVVVMGVDVQLGSRLNPEMLSVADWPSSSIPPGAFTDVKALEGRVVKTTLQRGEAVLESKLAPQGTRGGLSAVVAEGKRAITVRVNDVIGVAGFALPGNYVDILVSTQQEARPGATGRDLAISKIVLERILVLAVAQEASRDDTKPKVVNAVTLEVTPEQAEKLDLARSVGTLSLVLRNQVDAKNLRTAGARKQDLLQMSAPQPAAKARVVYRAPTVPVAAVAPQKHKIELIKGMSKSDVEF
ncbi:MAG: Flp pilus assembly protein CpaB [Rhodospirillaceae bacterium]